MYSTSLKTRLALQSTCSSGQTGWRSPEKLSRWTSEGGGFLTVKKITARGVVFEF